MLSIPVLEGPDDGLECRLKALTGRKVAMAGCWKASCGFILHFIPVLPPDRVPVPGTDTFVNSKVETLIERNRPPHCLPGTVLHSGNILPGYLLVKKCMIICQRQVL